MWTASRRPHTADVLPLHHTDSLLGASKYILNVRRSGPMWETTNIQLGFDTPFSVIQDFRTRLRQYVSDNGREWKGGLDVNVDFMQNQNLIQLIIVRPRLPRTREGEWLTAT